MANEVLYIRNKRPNAVLIRYETDGGKQVKFTVERRGSREDTIALPGELKQDPTVASFLNRGILEEISKDEFMTLGERKEGRPAFALKKSADELNLPMSNADAREPFQILDKTITDSKHLRSPHPEFAERTPSTTEEILTGVRQPLPELKQNKSSISTTKEERLENQVADLQETVAQLAKLVELSMQPKAETSAPWIPSPADIEAMREFDEAEAPKKATPES